MSKHIALVWIGSFLAIVSSGCTKPNSTAQDRRVPARQVNNARPAVGRAADKVKEPTGPREIEPDDVPTGRLAGKIVFNSYRSGASFVYLMNADGSAVRPLRVGGGATWSPDGRYLACTAFYNDTNRFEIVLASTGGKFLRRITKSPEEDSTSPAWSPDRRRFAFQSGDFNKPSIYLMNVDGSGRRRLTPPKSNDRQPCWSPDGKRIAFASFRDGRRQGIYVMNADGSDVRRITPQETGCSEPAWSPDGRHIAYIAYDHKTWTRSLRVMQADTGNWWTLLEHKTRKGHIGSPSWSPDAGWIAFSMTVNKHKDVCVITSRGEGLKNLTNHPKPDGSPSWSPVY